MSTERSEIDMMFEGKQFTMSASLPSDICFVIPTTNPSLTSANKQRLMYETNKQTTFPFNHCERKTHI